MFFAILTSFAALLSPQPSETPEKCPLESLGLALKHWVSDPDPRYPRETHAGPAAKHAPCVGVYGHNVNEYRFAFDGPPYRPSFYRGVPWEQC